MAILNNATAIYTGSMPVSRVMVGVMQVWPGGGIIPPADLLPPPTSFPNATNTGWQPTGVTLQTLTDSSSGPGWYCATVGAGYKNLYVTGDGAVLDGLDIDGRYLRIMANNVTVRRCRIRNGGYYSIFIGDLPDTFSGLVMEDCEIDGTGDTVNLTIAINASVNARFTRCNIHSMASSGPRLMTGTIIEDSWLHDYVHGDGGHEAGVSSNDQNTAGIILRRNHISINSGGASSAIAIYRDFGNPHDITVYNNLINGGNYGIFCGIQDSGHTFTPVDNIRFYNNVFGREFYPECGYYGPYAQWSSTNGNGNVWSGNVWGGGAAATGAHAVGDPVIGN